MLRRVAPARTRGNRGPVASGDPDLALQALDIAVGYGSGPVVEAINLAVRPGKMAALIGPNGAGKTTILRALAGELGLISGSVYMHGQAIASPLHRRAKSGGLAYVSAERSVFSSLTTRENLRIGTSDPDLALSLFPDLEPRLDVPAGQLSGGEQQMLTLGRALSRRPRILLADELSLGLAPKIVTRLLRAVRDAADGGCAVLLVEQHVRQALNHCDHAYVLRRGRNHLSGPATEMQNRLAEIEDSYLADGGS